MGPNGIGLRGAKEKIHSPHFHRLGVRAPISPVTIMIQSMKMVHTMVGQGKPAVSMRSRRSKGVVMNLA
jgi:hypothetical protein